MRRTCRTGRAAPGRPETETASRFGVSRGRVGPYLPHPPPPPPDEVPMWFWDAAAALPTVPLLCLGVALLVAFGFEFINGFHDTANAVTTVIYTRTMRPTPSVIYSGFMNFLGVLLGGTGVAFGIVNLLPVELLVAENAE